MIIVQYCILIIHINHGTLWSLRLSKYFVATPALESILHLSRTASLQKGTFWKHCLPAQRAALAAARLLQSAQGEESMFLKTIIMWKLVRWSFAVCCSLRPVPTCAGHSAPFLYSSVIKILSWNLVRANTNTCLFRQEWHHGFSFSKWPYRNLVWTQKMWTTEVTGLRY